MSESPKSTKSSKRKAFKTKFKIISILVICGALLLLGFIAGLKFSSSKAVPQPQTTSLGFENIEELATQEAILTEVEPFQGGRNLFGIEIPFTETIKIYSYSVVIKAGYKDFGAITYQVDEQKKTVTIQLPEAEVLSCSLDLDSMKIYYEYENIFRPYTLNEGNEAMQKMEENAAQDAIANGLLENARTNAETILKGFFSPHYDPNEYQYIFEQGE